MVMLALIEFPFILIPLVFGRHLSVYLLLLSLGLRLDNTIEEHLALSVLFTNSRVIHFRANIEYASCH